MQMSLLDGNKKSGKWFGFEKWATRPKVDNLSTLWMAITFFTFSGESKIFCKKKMFFFFFKKKSLYMRDPTYTTGCRHHRTGRGQKISSCWLARASQRKHFQYKRSWKKKERGPHWDFWPNLHRWGWFFPVRDVGQQISVLFFQEKNMFIFKKENIEDDEVEISNIDRSAAEWTGGREINWTPSGSNSIAWMNEATWGATFKWFMKNGRQLLIFSPLVFFFSMKPFHSGRISSQLDLLT